MLTWVKINLAAIENNVKRIRELLDPETKIVAVVKSNAYGHGLVEVGRTAWAAGAEMLGVGSLEEGALLRMSKVRAPILVMGYSEPEEYRRILENSLQVTVFNKEEIALLGKMAAEAHMPVRVHLKIDTGMHRLGVAPDELVDYVTLIRQEPYLVLEAVFSHFADVENAAHSKEQIKTLHSALFNLQRAGFELPAVHMAASGAISRYSESYFDMVRPGLAIYGLDDNIEGLEPALSWYSKIAQVKRVAADQKVGYSLTYTTKRISSLAVVPVGYADGYPRSLSNKGQVLVRGQRVNVVGRICMGQMILDVTGINTRVGDEVTLIGKSGNDTIKAQELAKWGDTNPHEIVARISSQVMRHFFRSEEDH